MFILVYVRNKKNNIIIKFITVNTTGSRSPTHWNICKHTDRQVANYPLASPRGGAKEGSCPPTGPGLDPEICANPMRSVNT